MRLMGLHLDAITGFLVWRTAMYRKAIVRRIAGKSGWVALVDDNDITTLDCSSGNQCSNCHMDCKKPSLVFVDDVNNASVGDMVELHIKNSSFLVATTVSLIFPLVMLVLGILLGQGIPSRQLLFGGIFLAIAVVFAIYWDKHFKASIRVSQIIERCYEEK